MMFVVLCIPFAYANAAIPLNDAQLHYVFTGAKISAIGGQCRNLHTGPVKETAVTDYQFDFKQDGSIRIQMDCDVGAATGDPGDGVPWSEFEDGVWEVRAGALCIESDGPVFEMTQILDYTCWQIGKGRFGLEAYDPKGERAFRFTDINHPIHASRDDLLAALKDVKNLANPAADNNVVAGKLSEQWAKLAEYNQKRREQEQALAVLARKREELEKAVSAASQSEIEDKAIAEELAKQKAELAEFAHKREEQEQALAVLARKREELEKAVSAASQSEIENKAVAEELAKQKAELAEFALKREEQEQALADLKRQREELESAIAATASKKDSKSDAEIWQQASTNNTIPAFLKYLEQFPTGRYAGKAAAKITVLERFKLVDGIDFGNFHALVIGINEYKYIQNLGTAIKDAEVVADVLENDYGFKETLLLNPDRGDILDALDEYRETLTDKDNLLIYYAGHGWQDESTGQGYWMASNAKPNRRHNWVSNATLTDTMKGLGAKHIMVVADSCFSGTLVRSGNIGFENADYKSGEYWRRMAEKQTRVAMVSGGLEPVADEGGSGHSPFAKAFIDALTENQVVVDGSALFQKLRRPVIVAARQTPQYSDVRDTGHDGGDFLFVRKF
jgi:hypothetical protein